jgi:tungstate transport system substrate-binding protein
MPVFLPEEYFSMKTFIKYLLLITFAVMAGNAVAEEKFITLASTTSTQNSGLFDYLLPKFREQTGIDVRVIAVGTGQALKIAEKGDADVILVHDKEAELKFVQQGYGIDRREVMYNDFIIVGPESDPAGIRGMQDVLQAFAGIAKKEASFISRADDSGTHRQELRLWKEARIDPKTYSGKWYKEVGAGMGATLNTAAGIDAYTMSDRGTWMTFKNRGNLTLLVEGDKRLFNQYAVILVNPAGHPHVKAVLARQFSDWLVSVAGQQLIGAYHIGGQILFYPNASQTAATSQ